MKVVSALIGLLACGNGASVQLQSQLHLRAQDLGKASSPTPSSLNGQSITAATPLAVENPPNTENGFTTLTGLGPLKAAGEKVIDWNNQFQGYTNTAGGTAMSYSLAATAEVLTVVTAVPPMNADEISRSLVMAGVAAIPDFGPLLSVMIGLIWPTKQVSLWSRIEPIVKKLIKADIDAAVDAIELQEVEHQVRLLKEDLRKYRRAQERHSALSVSNKRPAFDSNSMEWYIRYNMLTETARSDARSSLHLAIARIESILDLILSKPSKKRARYLGYFGHLSFLHLAMLKTDFIDFSGSVAQLVSSAPLYAQQVNTMVADLLASCIANINCGITNTQTDSAGITTWTWKCYPGGDPSNIIVLFVWDNEYCYRWNEQCNRPSNMRYRQSSVNKIQNYCTKSWIGQVKDDLGVDVLSSASATSYALDVIANTTAYSDIVASVITTAPSQVVASSGGLCAAFDSATMKAVLVSCAAKSDEMIFSTQVQDQLLAFDAKGQLHPLSDFALCLSLSISDVSSLSSQQLVFRECLNLPTQAWHPVQQSGGSMKFALAADPQGKWCVSASTTNNVLQLGDCTLAQTVFSLQPVPDSDDNIFTALQRNCTGWHGDANWWKKSGANDEIDVYFQNNFERALAFCRQGMSPDPLSCPTKQAIWSPCIAPRRVADDGQQFVPEDGWKYFFGTNDFVLDVNTPVKVFPTGQSLNCGTENFGVDIAPGGINYGCWAIPNLSAECQAKVPPDLCPLDKTFPDPRLCTEGVCSNGPVTEIPSSPSFVAWENNGLSLPSTGTFYMGTAGDFVATMVDNRLKSGTSCNNWIFFGIDRAYGKQKQCFFLPDIQP